MEVTTNAPEWDLQEDREIFAQFLKTRTGSRLVPKILESMPPLLAKGADNEVFIRSGEVRGWQGAISALLGLAIPEPKVETQESTSYPSLTDDAKWEDGQKLSDKHNP